MKWLFYLLILICILSGTASEICPVEACIAVCLCTVLGAFFEYRNIRIQWLNRLIAVLLYIGLALFEIAQGGGFQSVILGICLDIVWALLAYRALTHEKTSERIQVAVLAVLPLACVAFSLQAVEFIAFILAYFFVLFAYLTNVSLAAPTTGSLACISHSEKQYTKFGRRFWFNITRLMAVALLAGAALFLIIPRYGADSNPAVPGVERPRGAFPDVELNKTGKIELDPALLFRANLPENEDGYYWKIDVQNVFNGTKWLFYPDDRAMPPAENRPNIPEPSLYQVHFVREWHDRRLPTIDGTVDLMNIDDESEKNTRFFQAYNGIWKRVSWKRSESLMGFQFHRIESERSVHDSAIFDRLYSPDHIWPAHGKKHPDRQKLVHLADEIVKNAHTDREKTVAVRNYLKNNYRYSLNRPVRNGPVVEDFLFEQKFGHCEVFSTAMAVLLAIENIRVRNVTGFVSNEFRDGYNNVRSAHAHSWVEVYLDGKWERFDPTPSGAQVVEPGLLLRIDDWFASYQTKDLYRWLAKYGLELLAWLLAIAITSLFAAAITRYIQKRLAPTKSVYASTWNELMKSCEASESTQSIAKIPLESWWSDDFPEYPELQAFAREYIQMRYDKCENAPDGRYARFVRNRDILKRKRDILRRIK